MNISNKWITRFGMAILMGLANLTALHGMEGETKLPHIVLHMDINKTIIAESTGKGFGPEEGLNALLSTAPEYAYAWGNGGEKMTYSAWVSKKFCGSDPALKKKRESAISGFIEAAKTHHHPMAREINHEFDSLVGALKVQYPGKVFASFLNLIAYLKEKKYSFSVVLRTFGKDLDGISKELVRDSLGQFTYGSFSKGILHLNDRVISNPAEMISAFEPGKNYAIQDSYDWWKENNFKAKGGKPFPVNVCDKQVLSIFFDDNADDLDKPILNIISVGKKANLSELIALGRVVAVDTRKAILDRNYYIAVVQRALEKWQEAERCQQKE